MMRAKQILFDQITKEDLFWISKGCAGAWDKATVEDQLEAIKNGYAWLFRVSGDMSGVFVLAMGNRKDRSLSLTALAGRGMIKNFEEFYSLVKQVCKKAGAKSLFGFVSREGLKRIYDRRTKAKPKATLFVEDLT